MSNQKLHVSAAGVALAKRYEGFRSRAYRDPIGKWTIGYGETRNVGPTTGPWTEKYAANRLRARLDGDFARPVRALPCRLTQPQFDALVSFVYNVGPGGIAPGTGIGRALRDGRMKDAADELLEWNKATRPDGQVITLLGLTLRRRAERKLFLTPVDAGPRYTPGERAMVRSIPAAMGSRAKRAAIRGRLRERANVLDAIIARGKTLADRTARRRTGDRRERLIGLRAAIRRTFPR